MTNQEFSTEAASLLARCSPEQRDDLVEMARTFGKSDEGAPTKASAFSGASDASLSGKSVNEMFPGLARLHGGGSERQDFDSRFPNANRLRG